MGGRHSNGEVERFLAGVELRQLFARDVRQSEAAPLVFLPDRQADAFRADCSEGHLICPVPDCPAPLYSAVGGSSGRRHHFRHRTEGADHGPEGYFHQVGKAVMAEWARAGRPGTQAALEVAVPAIDRRADVLVTSADGDRFAIEVQYAQENFASWKRRDEDYRSQGIIPVWVFGHLRPHLAPPRGHHKPGEVLVTALARQILDVRRGPVFLLNPDTRQLARLLDRDDLAAVRELDDDLPYVGFDDALLGVSPLEACTLTGEGLRSPWCARVEAGHRRRRDRVLREQRARLQREERERQEVAAREERNRRAQAAQLAAAEKRRRRAFEDHERTTAAVRRARARLGNPEHVALAAGGPSIGGLTSDTWRTAIYDAEIHGRVGRDMPARVLYGRAKAIASTVDPSLRAPAVTEWVFALRDLRILDFASLGRAIVGPIRVLADVDHPAPITVAQRRKSMRVHGEDDLYVAVDDERRRLFIIDRRGRVITQRALVTSSTDARPVATPAPPAPTTQPPSAAELYAEASAESPAPNAGVGAPEWVTGTLRTDQRVRFDPAVWHAAIWDRLIRGRVGMECTWEQLMAVLISCGIRPNAHAEDALQGFLVHLSRERVVRFTTRAGRAPRTIEVLARAAMQITRVPS